METVKPSSPVRPRRNFYGLDHETIFYDPASFVAAGPGGVSLHVSRRPTIRSAAHLHRVPVSPRTSRVCPAADAQDPDYIDYYNRPWARNWEKWFEAGWRKPAEEPPVDVFGR